MTLSVEDFLLSIQKLILGNDLNTTYKLALVLAVTNKAGEIPFVNHPDAEVFEISYRELALEFCASIGHKPKPIREPTTVLSKTLCCDKASAAVTRLSFR